MPQALALYRGRRLRHAAASLPHHFAHDMRALHALVACACLRAALLLRPSCTRYSSASCSGTRCSGTLPKGATTNTSLTQPACWTPLRTLTSAIGCGVGNSLAQVRWQRQVRWHFVQGEPRRAAVQLRGLVQACDLGLCTVMHRLHVQLRLS